MSAFRYWLLGGNSYFPLLTAQRSIIQWLMIQGSVSKSWGLCMRRSTGAMLIAALAATLCWSGVEAVLAKESISPKARSRSFQAGRQRESAGRINSAAVRYQLKKTVDISSLTFHTPFSEAIEILSRSTKPPLNIVVLWRDLSENAFIGPTTPIMMEGVPQARLETGLKLVLRAVSSTGGQLGYAVRDGLIIVATNESLLTKMVTRIYYIRDLASAPANYRLGMPMGPYGPGGAIGGFWPAPGGFMGLGGAWRNYGMRPGAAYGFPGGNGRTQELSGVIRNTVRPGMWR